MNRIKILGLMIVAAAALMAVVGPGTASATETALCKEKTTFSGLPICQPEHLWGAGTTIHAEAETFLLIQSPLGNVECEQSTIKATTEKATSIPLGAVVEALTFTQCFGDTVTTVEKGTLDIEIIDLPEWTHNGTLTFTGTKVEVIKAGIKCLYSIGHAGTITGGKMATIDLSGTLTKVGGGVFCPAQNVNFIAFYTVTSPEPLWIST